MLSEIISNPYRTLGIYANSSKKEAVSNTSKISAYLKVGQEISMPVDFIPLLGPINRNEESLSNAKAELSLPVDQMKNAQFWFIHETPLDEIAFNNINANEFPKALEIWSKKECVSSLQNSIVLNLILADYKSALFAAQILYEQHYVEFSKEITGKENTISRIELINNFIDTIISNKLISPEKLAEMLFIKDWKVCLRNKTSSSLIEKIKTEIESSSSIPNETSELNYSTAKHLIEIGETSYKQLQEILPLSDLRVEKIGDLLGLRILQLGINFFKHSQASDKAEETYDILESASNLVVSKLATERCMENLSALKEIIDTRPQKVDLDAYNSLLDCIKSFKNLNPKINSTIDFLNEGKVYLQEIENQLGIADSKYISISTSVISIATETFIKILNEIIERYGSPYLSGTADKVFPLIEVDVKKTWNAFEMMSEMAMNPEYRSSTFNKNKEILKEIYDQCEASMNTACVSSQTQRRNPQKKEQNPSHQESNTDPGCLIMIILSIILIIFTLIIGNQ